MITNFSLDSYTITDTRSRHKDTNYCTVSITVGDNPAVTKTKSMGDQNNGTFHPGLGVSADVPTDQSVPVVLSYVILNNGHGSPGDVEKGIRAALDALGQAGTKAATNALGDAVSSELGSILGTAAVPLAGPAINALAKWLTNEVGKILFANCDGVVAAGLHIYASTDLANQTANGNKISETVSHPGTKSAAGCGGNSNYSTATTISARRVSNRLWPANNAASDYRRPVWWYVITTQALSAIIAELLSKSCYTPKSQSPER